MRSARESAIRYIIPSCIVYTVIYVVVRGQYFKVDACEDG